MTEDATDQPEDDSELEDHEDGRRQYSETEFFEAIQSIEHPTTGDISDDIGCTPQAALFRLNKMEEEGEVSSTMIGRAKVWFSNE